MTVFWLSDLPIDCEYLLSPPTAGLTFLIWSRLATIFCWRFLPARVNAFLPTSLLLPGNKSCSKY